MKFDVIIAGGVVVTSQDQFRADVGVAEGRIAAVATPDQLPPAEGRSRIDATGLLIMPGLIDVHVHLYEPGWPDWEDFLSGTQAAAAGGITTILEMPNSIPPVDSAEVLVERRRIVEKRAVVDFGLYGGLGVSNGGAAAGLAEAGAVAFKTFRSLAPAGSEKARLEGGLRAADPGIMLERLKESAATGLIHAVHVEDENLAQHFMAQARAQGWQQPRYHNAGRPELCEIVATLETLALARVAGARLHLVHMSSPEAVTRALEARTAGQDITVETCPHYLLFSSDDMEQFGPYAKVHPPLRDPASRERLWELVRSGDVDILATDHSPYAIEEKEKHKEDIWAALAGAPGLETMLPTMLTQVHAGRLTLARLVELTSENPARRFGLFPRKGTIRLGADADLVLIDFDREYVLRASEFFSKGRAAARWVDGMIVRGMPVTTLVRGTVVYQRGEIVVPPGHGQFVQP